MPEQTQQQPQSTPAQRAEMKLMGLRGEDPRSWNRLFGSQGKSRPITAEDAARMMSGPIGVHEECWERDH